MTKFDFKNIKPVDVKAEALEQNRSSLSNRFVKADLDGKELLFEATQWATLTDKETGLMWVNNWNADDTFPVCQVKWFQTGEEYCDRNHDETWNNGYNTENWITTINRHGWAGHNDWRLPTIDELKTLMLQISHAGKTEFDKFNYDQLFSDDNKNGLFWSSSLSEKNPFSGFAIASASAAGVKVGDFNHGSVDKFIEKSYSHYVRAVRSV